MLVYTDRGIACRNFYQDLGVSFLAEDEEVRQAYRRIALKYHPDRRPAGHDAEERFLRAAEAYEVLSDPKSRQVYDNACQYWLSIEEYLGAFGELLLTVSGLGLQTGSGSGSQEAGDRVACGGLSFPTRPAPAGSLLTAV